MIDIYDEVGYIKDVISNGLSPKWERDAILLARYYKMEGYKKSQIKKMIQTKCEEAASRKDNPIIYNHLINYKRLNSIIDSAWKKKTPLRAIHYIETSKEVVDWFLGLRENFVISDEEVKKLYERRGIKVKNNRPINWNRTKYLFTLYVWSKIQENYLERPNVHYLQKYNKRFKEDADLKQSFSMKNERDFLYDLGLIDVNFALGIETSFMELDVFKTEITDSNRVLIETGEPGEGDLYRPGYWLEKQRYGTFICKKCGREFIHYSNSKAEMARKYCKECAKKIGHGITGEDYKIIKCIDCGKEVKISKFDNKTCRCFRCQSERDSEKIHLRVKKYREKHSQVTLASGLSKNPKTL